MSSSRGLIVAVAATAWVQARAQESIVPPPMRIPAERAQIEVRRLRAELTAQPASGSDAVVPLRARISAAEARLTLARLLAAGGGRAEEALRQYNLLLKANPE